MHGRLSIVTWAGALNKGFDMAEGEPLFRSLSTNNYGKRLGYWGIYEMIKDLAEIAELHGERPSASIAAYVWHAASDEGHAA